MKKTTVTYENKLHRNSVLCLPIITGKNIILLRFSSVIYIEANGSYSRIITSDKVYYTCRNIGSYEKLLPTDSFCRVHNKFIVNIHHVTMIIREHHWSLALSVSSIIKVSDQKKELLLETIGLVSGA